ncbi:hypothetical protein EVAR_32259_1 [Eumeta japonica]|uniref:Uncharacterized protein n=1 Tax=Eumeta variegata TaxID=151549 RepID=A0A4C1X1Z6_EUMVA|nr:hypothetical protein EVAR_32259_1 [Eumeta japonica]
MLQKVQATEVILYQLQNSAWCKSAWCIPSIGKETNQLIRQCLNLPPPDTSIGIDETIKKSNDFSIPFPIESVREFGTNIEKALYKDMSIPEFIDRMLSKRAISFYGGIDKYKLMTGETGIEGWETVGTLQQKTPLVLENCLSYDEMKLSAMVFVSGFTEFINDGTRYNVGVVNEENIIKDGVIIGLIGTRLHRKFKIDYEDILITDQQNTFENGYGAEMTSTTNLNEFMSTEGLGAWIELPHQIDVFILSFLERLRFYLDNEMLNHITDVNFAYIKPSSSIEGGINVHLENREPSAKLPKEYADKLLVTTYAWNGNAHPGNDFWLGNLTSSGDPAAACSTQVAELHNAHINGAVCAKNLRVAGAHGVLPLREYCKKLQ